MKLVGKGLPHLLDLGLEISDRFFKSWSLWFLCFDFIAEIADHVLILFITQLKIAYLMLVLYNFGKDFIQIPFGLQFFTLKHLFILLMNINGLFHLQLVSLKFKLEFRMLAYLLFQTCKNILVCWKLVDRRGNFCEESMGWKYPFIWSDLFLDGIVLCPDLEYLLLLLFLQCC